MDAKIELKAAALSAKTCASLSAVFADSAAAFNSILRPQGDELRYFTDGKFNEALFRKENAGNDIAIGNLDLIQGVTNYSRGKQSEIKAGLFSNKGLTYAVPQGITEKTFEQGVIDITPNGVKPEQMIQAGMFGKFQGDLFEQKVDHTGDICRAPA